MGHFLYHTNHFHVVDQCVSSWDIAMCCSSMLKYVEIKEMGQDASTPKDLGRFNGVRTDDQALTPG